MIVELLKDKQLLPEVRRLRSLVFESERVLHACAACPRCLHTKRTSPCNRSSSMQATTWRRRSLARRTNGCTLALASNTQRAQLKHAVDDLVVPQDEALRPAATALAARLRAAGRAVDLVLEPKKLKWAFRQAERVGAGARLLLRWVVAPAGRRRAPPIRLRAAGGQRRGRHVCAWAARWGGCACPAAQRSLTERSCRRFSLPTLFQRLPRSTRGAGGARRVGAGHSAGQGPGQPHRGGRACGPAGLRAGLEAWRASGARSQHGPCLRGASGCARRAAVASPARIALDEQTHGLHLQCGHSRDLADAKGGCVALRA